MGRVDGKVALTTGAARGQGRAHEDDTIAARMTGLSKRFPGTLALDDVDLTVSRGSIHGLLGGNGSGKSTLIKILSGVYTADSGGVLELDGVETSTDDWSSTAARTAGVHVVHQDLGVFDDLSVAENFAIGQGYETGVLRTIRWSRLFRRAADLIERFEIDAGPKTKLGALSQSQRTLVAIARTLQDVSVGRGLLILDEPTASLPAHEVVQLHGHLRRLAEAGQAILYVTHRLDEILTLTDRVTVLRDGRVIANVETETLDEQGLIRLITGHDLDAAHRGAPHPTQSGVTPALEFRGVSVGPLETIDLQVGRGEILGIAGLLGSGRSTLLDAVFGNAVPRAGDILLDGKRTAFRLPKDAAAAGVAYVPEDRRQDAAFPDLQVSTNITAAGIRDYWSARGMRTRDRERDSRDLMRRFRVKAPSEKSLFSTLSGGNQQKVILARWVSREPAVLLLDEPTQGVDVGARAEIHQMIRDAAGRGAAVVVVASDFEELVEIADRAIVVRDGSIVADLGPAQMTVARLTELAYLSEKDM